MFKWHCLREGVKKNSTLISDNQPSGDIKSTLFYQYNIQTFAKPRDFIAETGFSNIYSWTLKIVLVSKHKDNIYKKKIYIFCCCRNFYKYSVKRYTQAKWRRFFASKIHNDSKKNQNDQIIEADRDVDGFHGFDEADLLDLKNPHEFLHAPCGLETYQRLKNGAPTFQLGPDFNN